MQPTHAQQTTFLHHWQRSIDLGKALLICSANLQQAMLKKYYCSTRVYWGVQHPGVEAKRRHQICINPDSVLGTVRGFPRTPLAIYISDLILMISLTDS